MSYWCSQNGHVEIECDAAVLWMIGVLVDKENMSSMTIGAASHEMNLI